MQRCSFCLNSLFFCVNSLSFCSLPCMLVHANMQCVYGSHNNFLVSILPWFLYHMIGNIQSRRIAPKDAACGRCRGIAAVGRRTNQNKCHTKKYPRFVLFSCRRCDHVRFWFVCYVWLGASSRLVLFFLKNNKYNSMSRLNHWLFPTKQKISITKL